MPRQAHSWHVSTHEMRHVEHGAFFVNVDTDGRADASRVWGEHPYLEHESLGRGYANAEEAKAACMRRIEELDQCAHMLCEGQAMDACMREAS
jgi:hypothetical protein